MDRESLKKHGLLEQYLLGLTSREETEAVEEYLASDPEAQRDLEFLRGQLGIYLDDPSVSGNFEAPAYKSAVHRDSSEQEHMMQYLLGRNQRLNVVRAVLGVVCLLLLGSTVYLYQQSRQLAADLLTEKARHVQDDHFHENTLRELELNTVSLDSMNTVVATSLRGPIQLHYLTTDSIILLDLSHLSPPDSGFAYHIHLQEDSEERSRYIINGEELNTLYPISNIADRLKVIYGYGPETTNPAATPTAPELILNKPLAAAIDASALPRLPQPQ